VSVVALSSCGPQEDACGHDRFDRATWAAADASHRRTIAQCGVDIRTFVGWSPSRACHELGKPYTARDRVWRWSLGPDDVGFRVVALELRFDRAERVETAGVIDAGEPETPSPLSRRVRAACAIQPQVARPETAPAAQVVAAAPQTCTRNTRASSQLCELSAEIAA
jgi:hypothetical protein